MSIVGAVIHDQALAAIVIVSVLAALLDLASGVLAAARTGQFDLAHLADFVGDHVLARVIPIVALGAFASVLSAALAGGVPENGQTAILSTLPDVTWLAAWTSLVAYLLETLRSLGVNVPTAVRGA